MADIKRQIQFILRPWQDQIGEVIDVETTHEKPQGLAVATWVIGR